MTKEKKGISKKEFDNFTKEMWKRLKEGEKKYGTEYKVCDIEQSIIEEATDLSNYAFLLFLRTKEYNKKINKTFKYSNLLQ